MQPNTVTLTPALRMALCHARYSPSDPTGERSKSLYIHTHDILNRLRWSFCKRLEALDIVEYCDIDDANTGFENGRQITEGIYWLTPLGEDLHRQEPDAWCPICKGKGEYKKRHSEIYKTGHIMPDGDQQTAQRTMWLTHTCTCKAAKTARAVAS